MPEDPERLNAIAARHITVADKIRALNGAGVARADIARFLGKRYQHVRNVLEGDAQSRPEGDGGGYILGKADLSGVQAGPRPFDQDSEGEQLERNAKEAFWLEIEPNGSLLLPPQLAQILGAAPERRIFARVANDRLILMSAEAARAEARAIVRKHVPPGVSLSDELIADRRAEAAREALDD